MRRWAFAFACAAVVWGATTVAADKPYQFGVFPYLPVTKIHELYGPMAQDFGAKLGMELRLSSKARYAAFEEELRRSTYDIAFVQPFDYVEAHDRYGYLPLARRAGGMEALIVVRDDSPLRALDDLKGKAIANPPADAAVSRLTSMALWDAGIDPNTGVRRDYGKNHFTCLQSVLIGAADACGTAEQPFRTLEKQRKTATGFRILHKTVRIPHAVFVVHARVPVRHRDVLLRTIVDWPKTEEGRRILDRGQFAPFVAARDAEYAVVRRYLRSQK
jgi:phosphonate transport system substrate-binding protein